MGSRGSPRPPLQRLGLHLSQHLLQLALLLVVCTSTVRAQNGGCVLHSQSGALITSQEWSRVILYLNEGTHKVESLPDTTENNTPYYTFTKTENINSVSLTTNKEYFKVVNNEDTLVIMTGDGFENSEPGWTYGTTAFQLSLEIQCGANNEVNPLYVVLDVNDSNNYLPELEQESYTFKFPVPLTTGTELTAQVPMKGKDNDVTAAQGSAKVLARQGATGQEAAAANLFTASASWSNRDVTVRLATAQDVLTVDPITFLVEVTDGGTRHDTEAKSKTVKVTFEPDMDASVLSPFFKEPLYKATFRKVEDVVKGAPLLTDRITFVDGSKKPEVTMEDGGAHLGVAANNFLKIDQADDGSVQLLWKEDLEDEQLESFLQQPYAMLTLTAEAEGAAYKGYAVVHLALPGAYVVPPPPSVQLEFKQQTYVADLASSAQVGESLAKPELKNAEDVEEVTFTLEKGSPSAPLSLLSISETTGEVKLAVAPPLTGTFEYVLVATAEGAYPARAQLLVRGPLVSSCQDGGACFEMALDVLEMEESERTQALSSNAGDVCDCCRYEILESDDYFTVNAATGEVTLKAVDREATVFDGAEEPVLRLKLRIVPCSEASALRNVSRASARGDGDRDFDDWVRAAEKSKNDPSTMVLLVVVKDVNDNAPVFDPTSIVVGFPSAVIAGQLRAPALYTVKATDRDIGDNAKIRYSVQEGSSGAAYVTVHEETGALYPRADASSAPADRTTVVVQATDRFGKPGDDNTNTGSLSITLRILEEKHLVELRVAGALPEEANEVLAKASSSSREMRLLTATTVPPAEEDKTREEEVRAESQPISHVVRARREAAIAAFEGEERQHQQRDGEEGGETELRMVVYSLRNGAPEDAKDFTEDLEKALKEAGYEAEAEEAALSGGGGNNNGGNEGGGGGGGGDGSDAGLLAAVIVLAVLLGLALIGAGVVTYIFIVRPRMKNQLAYNNLESKLSSVAGDNESVSKDRLSAANEPISTSMGMDLNPTAPVDHELQATNPALRLSGVGGGGGGGDVETRDDISSDGYMRAWTPDPQYEELPTPASSQAGEGGDADSVDTYLSRKTVIFNEDVDCIEIRM